MTTRARKKSITDSVPPLMERYNDAISPRGMQWDDEQAELVHSLQKLLIAFEGYASGRRGLISFFTQAELPKGLYIWGDVGRGKSFLMDMFYEAIESPLKRRVHFHAFMQDVHFSLHTMPPEDKNLDTLAKQIASKTLLLCFDEFQVTNIADAMIMRRLFKALFEAGVVVVATSNTPPKFLYLNGLHRERFLPFIEVLKAHVQVFHLNGGQDYRRQLVEGRKRYFYPLNKRSQKAMDSMWDKLTGGDTPISHQVSTKGRTLVIPHYAHRVARFTFQDLCGRPLGQCDYLALAEDLSCLLLEDIPKLSPDDRDQAHRLQILIDILYDNNVLFVASGMTDIDEIYTEGQGVESFKRTTSRIHEMCHV